MKTVMCRCNCHGPEFMIPQQSSECGDCAILRNLIPKLKETFETADAINKWMNTSNPYFLKTPWEAIRDHRVDLVYAALEALDSGIFI